MKKITLGITAHVDSGKTTLAEALLYKSGSIRKWGRVDNGNTLLDTDTIEKNRGITIFSHQADFIAGDTHFFLLDTPGHVDFSAETERTMHVLDCAVLVISAADGVQSHTLTLWKLLSKYNVPVFIFVNKTDLIGADREAALNDLKRRLSDKCTDFTLEDEAVSESCAACSEELMEKYFSEGCLTDNDVADAVSKRLVFPCFFGSALKMDGVDEFIKGLSRFCKEPQRADIQGARVFKIAYDPKGSRLTYLKITGGRINVREELALIDQNGNEVHEKISSLRFYSGEKFRTAESACAGEICAVTGPLSTFAGMGIGCEKTSCEAVLEPVMTYRIELPKEKRIHDVLSDIKRLEDEDPQLHVIWNEQLREIHIQLMGAVQLEVLTQLIEQRFGYTVSFEDGAVAYRETIKAPVEGVGHYEPLRHYAEVHLLLEPLERGSGLKLDTICSEDSLDRNWQRLILTHLQEKTHKGVLTGSPITDMRITLASGRAHLKHTEGGDFRQATYRAVRQGLRSAESVILEPYYEYEIELPTECVGRALADLQRMSAEFESPEPIGDSSVIRGYAPVSEINGYQSELIGYTRGRGRISLTLSGYRECHNPEKVIADMSYDCDGDLENSADSVFCSHGAGYVVKWDEVPDKMHLPPCLESRSGEGYVPPEKRCNFTISEEELTEIFERTYGKLKQDPRRAFKKTKAEHVIKECGKPKVYKSPDYLLVDGYNIIFAWDELKKIAAENLDAARGELIKLMCNYQGYDGSELILVFDAYKVSGKHRDVEKYLNINIVYTKEKETADSYIERTTHELAKEHRVRVATSDGPEQMIIFGSGAMRISADELRRRYMAVERELREFIDKY